MKVAKPQQDMRFDVPTIGITTIENLHKAGAKVLAIEAGKTILLDEPEVLALADRYGLSIVSIGGDVTKSLPKADSSPEGRPAQGRAWRRALGNGAGCFRRADGPGSARAIPGSPARPHDARAAPRRRAVPPRRR